MVEQVDTGVVFPTGADGRRSTTATGRAVWADSVRPVDGQLAARIEQEKDWRRSYVERVVEVTAAATCSPGAAVAVARAGLDALGARMRFERGEAHGSITELAGVMADEGANEGANEGGAGTSTSLGTHVTAGHGERARELVVPYRGQQLRGSALLQQLDDWVARSRVEPSFADALRRVVENPEWLDLRDRAFAVLGAGAEMGPVEPLLSWGAHVAAVDLPVRGIWERLLAAGHAGAGTLEVPLRPGASVDGDIADEAGVDLLVQLPEVARWVSGAAQGLPLTVGSYAYADGARHVQVAVASDAVVQHVLRTRPGTSYAELATPTDAYVVPADLVEDARRRWQARGWRGVAQAPARLLSRGALYAPAYPRTLRRDDGTEVAVADVLVPQQGPNYTLAKRLQRWRATVSLADGVVVSANVAPATSTRSVTKNRLLAAAYAGASTFGVEVFSPETSRVLMAALLVHDLRSEPPAVAHPDDLFVQQCAHGGLWRVPYSPRSVLGLAAVRGLPGAVLRR